MPDRSEDPRTGGAEGGGTVRPGTSSRIRARKAAFRRKLRQELRALSDDERHKGGRAVFEHLQPLLRERSASRPDPVVAFFANLPWEIDTDPIDEGLQRMGLGRALPAYRTGELEFHRLPTGRAARDSPVDRLRIPTPPEGLPRVPLEACCAVLVPGLAFGPTGVRLGQGGGFYDRALARLRASGTSNRPVTIGIGMDLQRRQEVPTEAHDQPVDRVITPSGGFPARPGRLGSDADRR